MDTSRQAAMLTREESGIALARKLGGYAGTNSVVIGIPRGGLPVAAALAKQLSLPLDVLPAQRIKHPGNPVDNLGSVCLTEVVLPEDTGGIPQDLVAHQIAILKTRNASDYWFYHEHRNPVSVTGKTVILVDDVLRSGEVILACIHELRKQKPLKVIAAIPFVSTEAARILSSEVDEAHFIRIEHEVGSPKMYFSDSARQAKNDVRKLVEANVERPLSRS